MQNRCVYFLNVFVVLKSNCAVNDEVIKTHFTASWIKVQKYKTKFDNTERSSEFVWDFHETLISKMKPSKLLSTLLWLLISFLGRLKGEIYDSNFNYVYTTPFWNSVIIMTSIKFHSWVMILSKIPAGKWLIPN